MKVLLIQPPFTIFKTEAKVCHPPLGLAYLAAVLKKDHDVLILDTLAEGYSEESVVDREVKRYGLSFENIKKRIESFLPDVVGVSCLFSAQTQNVKKICKLAKEIDKKAITVIGGAHPSTLPEEMLEDSNVDFVVIGEGEEKIRKLLEYIENKKDMQLEDMDGIGFRYNGSIKINGRNIYSTNLDTFPFPYWDAFPLERYFFIGAPHGGLTKKAPFLPVITSRGCPFECIFCSVHNLWGRDYRKRSTENVLMELDYLVDRFGVKEILFEDDNLTLDKERAKEIFNGMINKKLEVNWSVPNGIAVQTLDEEMLELMKASGCHHISIGVESGDEYVLKNIIKKPIDLRIVKSVINKAKILGLETTVFFVVGLPGETKRQLKNTFLLAEDLGADNVNFFFATPLPGTRLLKVCKEKELIKGDLDFTRLKSDYPVFATEAYSIDELKSVVFRERIKLYFLYALKNPQKFVRELWHKVLSDPKYFVRFILRYQKIKND
ncbi:MAG: hypothetical protein AMJ78_01795 [Omnitrophica WOR_2 bacterium SM23_29]|nr:MAG: hypothetical protein AMJ78_01795 [Omnitrophica WOR_2 bacterium SM23_29]